MWTGYSPETFNETLGALHHARFLGSCLYIMKLVMLLFNLTPTGHLTPNMLTKMYDHDYRTRVPSTQSWLLRHHGWTSSYIVWEQMCTYHDNDTTIVRVVRRSLLQHLWYLTEYLVVPAFLMSLWFLVWKKLWLHSTQVHLYPSIPDALKISWEIHGDASPEHDEYLVFIWMTCNIKNYSLMSLNVTITQPITL